MKKNILIILLTIFVAWIVWGNITFQISHQIITDDNLPDEFNGFKIAHVSDLHSKNWGYQLVETIEVEQPDLIAITGDLIDSNTEDVYIALDFVEKIKHIAPIYFVSGNHEAWSDLYPMLEEGLLNAGVTILNDEKALITQDDGEVSLLGLADPTFTNGEGYFEQSNLQELIADTSSYQILLAHRPELFEVYVDHEINLVLSGHAHGGQFSLPFIGGIIAPDQGFFPKYTSGVYEEGNTSMIVSRGLGNSIIPIRFNNRSEIIFITLKSNT